MMNKIFMFLLFLVIIYYHKHAPGNINEDPHLPEEPISKIFFDPFNSKPNYIDKKHRIKPKYIKVD